MEKLLDGKILINEKDPNKIMLMNLVLESVSQDMGNLEKIQTILNEVKDGKGRI